MLAHNEIRQWQHWVADEINAVAEHSPRTADQVKKCWDNMKTRRKKELSEEKRQRFLTGSGPEEEGAPENSFVDDAINTVDIEIRDEIDSDAVYLRRKNIEHSQNSESSTAQTSYSLSEEEEEGPSQPKRKPYREENMTLFKSRGTAIQKELEARLNKTEILVEHERELHKLKITEQNLNILEAKARLDIAKEVLRQEQMKTEQMLKEYNKTNL